MLRRQGIFTTGLLNGIIKITEVTGIFREFLSIPGEAHCKCCVLYGKTA
jgi:hypothetical protein